MTALTRRRWLHWGIATGAGLMAGAAGAQDTPTPSRRFRIFMVLGRGEGTNEQGFKDHLARSGLEIDYITRNTGGDSSLLPGIVKEIKELRPDLVYTWGTPQTRAVVGPWDDPDPGPYVRDLPVLFTYVATPLDAKIVPQLERPGGNVTGTIHIAPITAQVNAILAYRPIRRLAMVFNPAERNSLLVLEELRDECARRDLELIEAPAPLTDGKPDPADIPHLIAQCRVRGGELLYLGPDTFITTTHRHEVAAAALAERLPTFSATELIVRSSRALFSLSSSPYGIGRLTGVKALQILVEGRAPGEIQVETLRRFSILINMATARELSCYPPLSLLNFAEVVEV